MTSKERVMAALEHREPDKVPVDFSGHRSSGIMAIAYAKLKEHLGITTGDIYVYDLVQQLAVVEPEVLDRFQVDVVELGRGFAQEESYWKEWELPDGTPCRIPAFVHLSEEDGDWYILASDGTPIAVQRQGCLYFEQICFPWQHPRAEDLDRLDEALGRIMWCAVGSPPAPLGFDEEGLRGLEFGARELREATDRAIVGLFGGSLHELGQWCYGMENYFCLLATEPSRMHRFFDRLTEIHLANLEKFLSAVGRYIDVIVFGDDLGMQTGPQISRRMYDQFLRPRHAVLWQRARELSEAKVMLHCCGSIHELMPSLIEAGLDAINPVQTSAAGMEPHRLKQEFAQDIVFWGGGCDTQSVLPLGTPLLIKEHVQEQARLLSPGGGFVFQQVHNIMADVPPENITAMFDAINAFSISPPAARS